MKKIVLLFALLGVVSLTVNAQSCPYSKNAAKTAVSAVSVDDAAAADVNIQKRVCQKSGTVSYMRKDVCQKSGKVSFAEVEYCTKSGKFVNVSPKDGLGDGATMSAKTVAGEGSTTAKKAGCTAAQKAACASKKASCSKKGGASSAAVSTSVSGSGATPAKKACCASKKASCSKSAKVSNSTTEAAPAKLIKVKAVDAQR